MSKPTRREPTPEQQRRREEVDAPNRRIQEGKIKPPASGVFGKPAKDNGKGAK